MVTISDVARHAGVSATTVSHVINATRFVDPATEARVREAIESLRYRPNSIARGLRVGETKTLGLLVPDNSNPFFADLAREIENAGFDAGYTVFLCNSDGSTVKEDKYLSVLLSRKVDGLIFAASANFSEGLTRALRLGLPTVLIDREISSARVDAVLVDNWQGGYLAGRYLLELGHRRFGVISGPNDTTSSPQRVGGFRQALREAGITLDPRAEVTADFHFEGGLAAMGELLDRVPALSAVFACNDLMAMGAMVTTRARGRLAPEQISIIGFDDIRYAATTWPPITTIAQPIEEVGRTALRVLLDRLKAPTGEPKRTLLQPRLVERNSCAVCPPSSG
ncbi:LacI family DNA-binding transcriptional regulator [Mesorhizobium sp. BAC0120]|uniref:LacI family DNA-binding transcriptional regulator n=1 Tax=Mesorhizobium sp. BAC0120 TaxID=3090670 RepID=UPI00298BF6FC|nr:LacI family DNA-binding transcriptional regulator [Mesorhizobium sp. BAC0120]MDW6026165.1 LacI family DNA-binding transcriptional regulator [Mesorhizobium sp. BAC0120]